MKPFKVFAAMALLFLCTTGCKTSQENGENTDTPSVLVQLVEDSGVQPLEEAFKEFGLQKEKLVSRPMHIFLFTFNPEKITDSELVVLLRQSELVKEAQQNRTVQTRK